MKIWVIKVSETSENFDSAVTFSSSRKYRNGFKQIIRRNVAEAKERAVGEVRHHIVIPLTWHEIIYTDFLGKEVVITVEGYTTELNNDDENKTCWGH